MTGGAVRRRVMRACVLASVIGLAATVMTFVIVRKDVDRLTARAIDRPAGEALLGVQAMSSAVDQILATANGVVATSGADPARFAAAFGPDIAANSTIAGMAVVTNGDTIPRVAARVGSTDLLRGNERAVWNADPSATLVDARRGRDVFQLAFAASVAHGSAAVFVQIVMPVVPGSSAPFALTRWSATGTDAVVLGNVENTAGLARWNQAVSLGGRRFDLFVAADGQPPAVAGLTLPRMVLLAGLLSTVALVILVRFAVRRSERAAELATENRALDLALEHQRKIDGELVAWQQRFRTILRDTPDVIAIVNVKQRTCEVLNRPDFLGHPLEPVQAPGGLDELVRPDDRDDAEQHWARLADLAPEQVCETTLRFRAADGDDRSLRLRFSPLNVEGDERVLLGLMSDVTDEWANQLREAELQEALRRSQRLEAVGHLAGGIAHDFNNILAAIIGSAELLLDEVPPGPTADYVGEISHSAERGAALVRQLLTFAQRDGAERAVVDLNLVVRDMEPLLRRALGEGVQLQITTPTAPCCVLGDPTHLEQVLLNLAVNSRDAMPDGGVLWIATAVDDLAIDSLGRVLLSVTDTGTGIPEDVREHMFDPFVTTKPTGKGTGLGLATVASIVNAMQGRIRVASDVGQGTMIEISFPRSLETPSEEPAVEPVAVAGNGLRVLLVEDDDAVRTALARTLAKHTFDVTPVANGGDALRALELHSFDVVLTDTVMPGMSGIALAERMYETRPGLPVVLMSGYSHDVERTETPAADCTRLRKPFTTPALLLALDEAIATRTPEEELT